jgi:hypothetical protein
MHLGTLIELVALVVAISGLILQTRRDTASPASWHNLSRSGRFVLCLLVLLAGIKVYKSYQDSTKSAQDSVAAEGREADLRRDLKNLGDSNRDMEKAAKQREFELNQKLAELREANRDLIKVASVATGYSALIQGVAVFSRPVNSVTIDEAFRNLFLKYAHIEISATNRFGLHQGRVDYGAHPEVRRYLSLSGRLNDPTLLKYQALVQETERSRSFFFEIRCSNFRILNNDRIQYVRFSNDPPIRATVAVFPQWDDFRRLYSLSKLYLDQVVIEELDTIPINRSMEVTGWMHDTQR